MKKRKFSPTIGKENKITASRDWDVPYEYDDTKELVDEITVEVPIDDIFIIDNGTLEDAEETKLDWTTQEESYDGNWYALVEGYDVPIRRPDEIEEDVLDVLINHMPYKSGKYHVTCTVHLVYYVSHVYVWDYNEFEPEINTEGMWVDLIFGKCYVSNLQIETIE